MQCSAPNCPFLTQENLPNYDMVMRSTLSLLPGRLLPLATQGPSPTSSPDQSCRMT